MDLEKTPCLLVNLNQVERNCKKMQEICGKAGIHLRPNMKTNKTVAIGVIATGGTKRRISVSTLKEAEVFADAGFDDILYTTPLVERKIPRTAALNEKLSTFHTMLDSVTGVQLLVNHPGSKNWSVFIKIDMGAKRAGILCEDTERLVRVTEAVMAAPNVTLNGLYFYDGHSYNVESDMPNFISEQFKKADQVIKVVKDRFPGSLELSYGSTPSCSQSEQSTSMTEFHPGAYVFYDVEQVTLGACTENEIAIKVAARVIGHYPLKGHMLIDCGFLGLSLDGVEIESGSVKGYKCIFEGHSELRLADINQEIGKVKAKEGHDLNFSEYPIGSLLFILPYHSCATSASHQEYVVVNDEGEKVAEWVPIKGW